MSEMLEAARAALAELAAWIGNDPAGAGIWAAVLGIAIAALTFLVGFGRSKPSKAASVNAANEAPGPERDTPPR